MSPRATFLVITGPTWVAIIVGALLIWRASRRERRRTVVERSTGDWFDLDYHHDEQDR